MLGGGPAERSLDFGASSRRLLRELAPEHRRIGLVLALGATSVALSVLGPRLLGDATNLIFGGVLGREIPAGTTRVQAIAELRRTGHVTQANLLAATHTSPGGVDFQHVGQVLLTVLLVYLGSAVAGYLQAR